MLLESGADPQAVDDEGATALHLSAAAGHWEITQLLLEKGAALTAAEAEPPLPLTLPDDEPPLPELPGGLWPPESEERAACVSRM